LSIPAAKIALFKDQALR
jgi:hypothetical protein